MHTHYRQTKKVELEEAYEILSECEAVIVEGYVMYPIVNELKDDEDNVFLELYWDDEGLVYILKFIEGDNKMVDIGESSIYLKDTGTDGQKIEITILTKKQL